MKPTTYKLLNIITYIVIFTSYALEGTCVYGQGSRNLQMTCWIIFGVFVVISLMLSAFKNKWVKQDSDQAVK